MANRNRFCYNARMSAHSSPVEAARRLRAAIRRALLSRAAWGALCFGLLLSGGSALALRIAAPSLPPLRLLPWCALPVGALFAALAIPALRRLPSRERCLAAVEAASKAGGLALCAGAPGAEAWPAPESVVPDVRFRPALPAALPLAFAFCALALALPGRLFERVLPPPPDPTGLRALAAHEERRLEALLEEGAIDEKKAAELREWLEETRANAETSSQAALLEALDHVARTLDDAATDAVAALNDLRAAEALASDLAAAAEAAPPAPEAAEAFGELVQALDLEKRVPQDIPSEMVEQVAALLAKLPPETAAALARKCAEGGRCEAADAPALSLRDLLAMQALLDELTPEALADLAAVLEKLSPQNVRKMIGGASEPDGGPREWMTPEEFRELLAKLHAAAGLTSNRLERLLRQGGPGCKNCKKALLPSPAAALDELLKRHDAAAAAASAALGACPMPGSGPDGGGGPAAPLGFAGDVAPAGPEDLRDVRLPAGAGAPDPSQGLLLGVSAADPDVAPAAAPTAAGALAPAAADAASSGATRTAPVFPRHQKAVESYFGADSPAP